MTPSSNEEKLYFTADQGLAAFLLFVLSESEFIGAEQKPESRFTRFVFRDTTRDNSCAELAALYNSGQAQLRDVREYANCHRIVYLAIREVVNERKKTRVESRTTS